MSDKMRAALIGGVTFGLLSAIPPISFAGLCCFIWIASGMLASYLYIRRSREPVLMGEGVQLGALAGLIGTIVALTVGLTFGFIFGESFDQLLVKMMERFSLRQAEELSQQLKAAQSQAFAQKLPNIVITSLVRSALSITFATLGGLLGVRFFEHRQNS
ncbi:MAG: hypothetical protein LC803_03060 [Acidobacteria bacterium]|nr:hypothetical protein [Acidobacteriota bacterium]